jgi:hypothetical protein
MGKQIVAAKSILIRVLAAVSVTLWFSVAGFAAPLLPVPASTVPFDGDLNP